MFCYSAKNETGALSCEERGCGKGLQLVIPFPWLAQMVCSQGISAGLGGRDKGICWGKKGWSRPLLGKGL